MLHIFIFSNFKVSGMGWLSNFLTSFSLLVTVQITFIVLAKLMPKDSPVYFIELKWFSISLIGSSSSSLSLPSSLLIPPSSFSLAMLGVLTNFSIWSSKSDPPYRDNSSSSGGYDYVQLFL